MDDMNQNNQTNESTNTSPTPESSGSFTGFDSVNGKPTPQDSPTGYTVDRDGGRYTVSHGDIIQDEPFKRQSEETTQPQEDKEAPPRAEYSQSFENNSYNRAGGGYSQSYGGYTRTTAPTPPPYRPKKEKKGAPIWLVVLSIILAAVIGAVSSAAVLLTVLPDTDTSSQSKGPDKNVTINVDEAADSIAQAVAEKATQSVVGIRTTTSVMSFFGGSSESTGEGSGVIYTADGYIITNYHVISSVIESGSSSKIEVFLENMQSEPYQASVVGYHISSDLAVIKINASGLPAIELGDSDELKVGQYVITIGNPGGLEFMGSVTYGIISGLNRTVSTSTRVELIQTDAAINPGNSGGALLNSEGKLIGINSSKIVAEEYEGMGFAIPVNTVKEKCDRIIARENEPEPYIGVTVSAKYTPDVLQYYGFPVGAVILSVDEDSPAYSAGIRRGDIITEFNGIAIEEYSMLGDLLLDCEPEQTVTVKLYRSGRTYSLKLKIGSNSN